MNDLVIGLAANYHWAAIEPFAVSLVRSGFSGAKVLFVKDLKGSARENLLALGFELLDIPNLEYSDPEMPCGRYFPYVGRFLLIHKYLEEHPGFRFAICADTRDVVFQGNPSTWLEKNIGASKLVAASEYILHRDQPGNVTWMNQAFKEIASRMLPQPIYCSGFISGRAEYVSDIALGIYLAGRHLTKSVWGSDQPVYNFIMHQKAYADVTLVPAMRDHYCINLVNMALTEERSRMTDRPDITPFQTYGAPPPQNLSLLWNYGIPDLSRFTVLHQYDRIVPLAEELRKEYCLANVHLPSPIRFDLSTF